jgi:ATP-dependent RNA helicase HelY
MGSMMEVSPSERYVAAKKRNKYPILGQFMLSYDFPFDEFQIEGSRFLEDGESVLIAAPTGAGKTIIGEFAAYLAIEKKVRCFYTTPIKALSNQKFQELTLRYGPEKVGLLTGDSSINGDAAIVVMTTEVLRNMIYSNPAGLDDLGYVVMDEVHYLADKFRGAVWEEILIHLPERIQVVSLSATVSNAEEFGEWLNTVRGETGIVVSELRPVPLYQHILIGNRLLDLFVDDGRVNPEILKLEKASSRGAHSNRWSNHHRAAPMRSLSKSEMVEQLLRREFLPAIFFIFSRAGCDASLLQCLNQGLDLTKTTEKIEIRKIIQLKTAELPHEDFGVLGFHDWSTALERGIATHHAGLLPMFKETVEELFQLGLLKVVFATETLALGINMPAKTVLLEKLIKWNGESHVAISPGEYTQLTGRAGRRGIDIEGNAVIVWSDQLDSAMAAGLAGTRTYPLRSSFTPTYNMTANLVARFGRERARKSLAASFAQFQADRGVVSLIRQIEKNSRLIVDLKKQSSCHLGDFQEYMGHRFKIRHIEKSLADDRYRRKERKSKIQQAESDIAESRTLMKSHPSHQCPDRESHARFLEKAERLERESSGLKTRMESRTNVIPKVFDKIVNVLETLDYISDEKLTKKGRILSGVYAETDLLLAELLNKNSFDHLAPAELVGILSSLVYESRGEASRSKIPRIPKGIDHLVREMASTWAYLSSIENELGLDNLREPNFDFLWSAYRWANGNSLQSVIRESDLTIGDFVRVMRQIIDLLGQISAVRGDLSKQSKDAISKIDRGVIAYSAVVA